MLSSGDGAVEVSSQQMIKLRISSGKLFGALDKLRTLLRVQINELG
jgi:hypothetical protein